MIASNIRWLDWVLVEGKESVEAEKMLLRFGRMRECLTFEKEGEGDG